MITLAISVDILAASPFSAFTGTGSRGSSGSGATVRSATVALYGDSIAAGACSSTQPSTALDALLPAGYTVSNEGVSGETAHQIYTRVVSGTTGVGVSTACLDSPCGHYIVQGGVNTLKTAGYAGLSASAVAEIALSGVGECSVGTSDSCGTLDSVDYIHVTYPNARVFVIGVLPYASCSVAVCPSLVDPGLRARTYNARLAEECATRSWLTCISPYDTFRDGETDNLSATYACVADGIHLKNEGSAELASQIYTSATW